MGLFDDVLADVNCMNCYQLLDGFQTKDFEHRCLRKIELGEDVRKEVPECPNNIEFNFYTFCHHCGFHHDATGVIIDGVFIEVKNVKMGEKIYDFEERGLKKC